MPIILLVMVVVIIIIVIVIVIVRKIRANKRGKTCQRAVEFRVFWLRMSETQR